MSGLEIDGVTVAYGERVVAGPLTLSVPAGGSLCLIGPNGAGKTSVLHAASGLVPYLGSVRVGGTVLDRLRPAERARLIALVPQQPTVPPDLTVLEYVLLGRTPHIPRFGMESAHDREVSDRVLARLDLGGFGPRMLGTLSGGELQRVLLARALAQETPVLLLDEPTSALDLGHQQQVLRLVEELRVDLGLTVVMTMHDLTLAAAYGEALVLVDAGRVVAAGPASTVLTEEVLRRHYHADVQVLRAADGTLAVVPLRHP